MIASWSSGKAISYLSEQNTILGFGDKEPNAGLPAVIDSVQPVFCVDLQS
jgi:hypothetical protein